MVCPTRPPASSSLGVSLGGLRARSGGGSRRPNGAGTRRALWRRKGSDTYVHRHYSPLNEVVIPFVTLHKLAAWKLASASPAYPSACPSAPHASTASRRPRERPVSALVLSRSLRRIHRASNWSCGFVPVVSCVPAPPPTSSVAFEDERTIARTVHEVESHGIVGLHDAEGFGGTHVACFVVIRVVLLGTSGFFDGLALERQEREASHEEHGGGGTAHHEVGVRDGFGGLLHRRRRRGQSRSCRRSHSERSVPIRSFLGHAPRDVRRSHCSFLHGRAWPRSFPTCASVSLVSSLVPRSSFSFFVFVGTPSERRAWDHVAAGGGHFLFLFLLFSRRCACTCTCAGTTSSCFGGHRIGSKGEPLRVRKGNRIGLERGTLSVRTPGSTPGRSVLHSDWSTRPGSYPRPGSQPLALGTSPSKEPGRNPVYAPFHSVRSSGVPPFCPDGEPEDPSKGGEDTPLPPPRLGERRYSHPAWRGSMGILEQCIHGVSEGKGRRTEVDAC